MVEKFEGAVKVLKLALVKHVHAKWITEAQANDLLGQYRKFISEAKQIHHEKSVGFRFGEDRLDSFLYEVLHAEKAYKDLWNTLKILLIFLNGQAATECGFSVNKEVLAPNLKKVNMTAIHHIHDFI